MRCLKNYIVKLEQVGSLVAVIVSEILNCIPQNNLNVITEILIHSRIIRRVPLLSKLQHVKFQDFVWNISLIFLPTIWEINSLIDKSKLFITEFYINKYASLENKFETN